MFGPQPSVNRPLHAAGEEVHRNPRRASPEGQQINLLNDRIGHRQAADALAVSVNEDVSTGTVCVAAHAVAGIRIVDAQAQMELADRVESVHRVEPLRYLAIALLPLWPRSSRLRCDRIGFDQYHRSGPVRAPHLQ